jgi:hypothetical protein
VFEEIDKTNTGKINKKLNREKFAVLANRSITLLESVLALAVCRKEKRRIQQLMERRELMKESAGKSRKKDRTCHQSTNAGKISGRC